MEPINEITVVGCSGRIEKIEKDGQPILESEHIKLCFRPSEAPDSYLKDIQQTEFLDIFYITENNRIRAPLKSLVPNTFNFDTEFSGSMYLAKLRAK